MITTFVIQVLMYALERYISAYQAKKEIREAYLKLAEELRKQGINISVSILKSEDQINEITEEWKKYGQQ